MYSKKWMKYSLMMALIPIKINNNRYNNKRDYKTQLSGNSLIKTKLLMVFKKNVNIVKKYTNHKQRHQIY